MLCPTDSRFRPDQRLLEEGQVSWKLILKFIFYLNDKDFFFFFFSRHLILELILQSRCSKITEICGTSFRVKVKSTKFLELIHSSLCHFYYRWNNTFRDMANRKYISFDFAQLFSWLTEIWKICGTWFCNLRTTLKIYALVSWLFYLIYIAFFIITDWRGWSRKI